MTEFILFILAVATAVQTGRVYLMILEMFAKANKNKDKKGDE